jgi:hypothetical protein
METDLQELEETSYWLELLIDAELFGSDRSFPKFITSVLTPPPSVLHYLRPHSSILRP